MSTPERNITPRKSPDNCVKTAELFSERTFEYMQEMGLKAQWVKPWTITTKISDFSTGLENILDEQFNPERSNTVWYSDITYIWTMDSFVYLTPASWICFP